MVAQTEQAQIAAEPVIAIRTDGLRQATDAEQAELMAAIWAAACPCENHLGAWRAARHAAAHSRGRLCHMLPWSGWVLVGLVWAGVALQAALWLLRV